MFSQLLLIEFHRLYYQYTPSRLSTCPLTIHALLHIADGIDACGPVWAYWAFPMERYCGALQPAIKSRRYPFASLDRHVVATAQLSQVKTRFNISQALSLIPPKPDVPNGAFQHPNCKCNSTEHQDAIEVNNLCRRFMHTSVTQKIARHY